MTSRLPRIQRGGTGSRPKVLLVDDHRGMLQRVSAILAHDFVVAGTATDGRQALDFAREADLDAIVLDINMPGWDGFETMHALQDTGSRVPVVFLSMVDADEEIGDAFRRGARGYVLKPFVARDLPGALDQVLSGRYFVPSLGSLFHVTTGAGHAMQLYEDVPAFLDGLAEFFDLCLQRGDATCVIATEDLRDGLDARLRARGWDVAGHNRYRVIPAADALGRFMVGGRADTERLRDIAQQLDDYRRETSESPDSRLTIFGNMVLPLITGGKVAAALDLERQWNRLTQALPFLTLCGYADSCFHGHGSDAWARACAEHRAISHANPI